MRRVKILLAVLVVCVLAVAGITIALNDAPGPSSPDRELSNKEENAGNDEGKGVKQGEQRQKGKEETGNSHVENGEGREDKKQDSEDGNRDETSGGESGMDSRDESYEQVVSKYRSRFEQLRSEYNGELNSLLRQAKEDVEEAESKNRLSLVGVAYDYYKEGRQLENKCDAEFYELLGEMEEELNKKNLPLEAVDKAEQEYKQQKQERRERLKSLATDYIKGE